jgi:hypothetical protein
MVEIPRSTFNFDFEYERRILAEAEKENPNWTKFVVERQAPPPVAQQARYIVPAIFFFLSFFDKSIINIINHYTAAIS